MKLPPRAPIPSPHDEDRRIGCHRVIECFECGGNERERGRGEDEVISLLAVANRGEMWRKESSQKTCSVAEDSTGGVLLSANARALQTISVTSLSMALNFVYDLHCLTISHYLLTGAVTMGHFSFQAATSSFVR